MDRRAEGRRARAITATVEASRIRDERLAAVASRLMLPRAAHLPGDRPAVLSYRSAAHRELPHIVKFSGGRSSAAMLLSLCRSERLDPDRNDVVLFANTGAEHPATYEFASRVCDEAEREHGIPCLWYEFCTVEDAGERGWRRLASYRLVQRRPAAPQDDRARPGYQSSGEPFEELASWKAMLPNRHVRLCTRYLKTLPGAMVAADWIAGGPGPARAGHGHSEAYAGASYRGSRMTAEENAKMRAYALARPTARPEQVWAHFTSVPVGRPDNGPRPRADVWGQNGRPVAFVALLGLRSDEPDRVERMLYRGMLAEGATSSACRDASQPAGEMGYAPLADSGVDNAEVHAFWKDDRQGYDLRIGSELGNCVFCFMKGEDRLSNLANIDDPERQEGTPSHIGWWANLESRYGGPSIRGGTFKFLSLGASSYQQIATGDLTLRSSAQLAAPCACTD